MSSSICKIISDFFAHCENRDATRFFTSRWIFPCKPYCASMRWLSAETCTAICTISRRRRPWKRCERQATKFWTASTRCEQTTWAQQQRSGCSKYRESFSSLYTKIQRFAFWAGRACWSWHAENKIIQRDRGGRERCVAREAGTGTSRQDASRPKRKCSLRFREGSCGAGRRLRPAIAPGRSGPW